eukprot:COSAG01_NODE_1165_length_11446_cov_16.276196_1_plen_121_part_00
MSPLLRLCTERTALLLVVAAVAAAAAWQVFYVPRSVVVHNSGEVPSCQRRQATSHVGDAPREEQQPPHQSCEPAAAAMRTARRGARGGGGRRRATWPSADAVWAIRRDSAWHAAAGPRLK